VDLCLEHSYPNILKSMRCTAKVFRVLSDVQAGNVLDLATKSLPLSEASASTG
jgi:hypothetical protein